MTIKGGINNGTRVSLSLRDYVAQATCLVGVAGACVWWINGRLAAQREFDVGQDARIGAIEQAQKRADSDSQAVNAALLKVTDRLEAVTFKLAEI